MRNNKHCFTRNHMTLRQFGLWNYVWDVQRKHGFIYFDGDTVSDGFQGTKRDVIFRECKVLLETGFFELIEDGGRKSDGTYKPRKIKALSHKEWVSEHTNECLSSRTSATGGKVIQSHRRYAPVAQALPHQSLPCDIDVSKDLDVSKKQTVVGPVPNCLGEKENK